MNIYAESAVPHFEYMTKHYEDLRRECNWDQNLVNDRMTYYGKQGWRIVTAWGHNGTNFLFERWVEDE